MNNVGGFCKTPFWNESISWNTGNPYLTECFEHLALVSASSAVLWVLAPIELAKIAKRHDLPNPWSTLILTKVVLKVILLLICTIDLVREIYSYVNDANSGMDGLVAAVIYLVTIILSLVITLLARKRGVLIMISLPSFWMLGTVTTLMSMYTEIREFETFDWNNTLGLVDDTIVFFISITQLILSCFSEKPAPVNEYARSYRNYCPLETVSLPSRLTFFWISSIFFRGLKNSLHQDHLIPMCSELKSSNIVGNFRGFHNEYPSKRAVIFAAEDTASLLHDDQNNEALGRGVAFDQLVYSKKKSLIWMLFKTSWKFLLISSILQLISVLLYFVPPYVLSLFLDYIHHDHFKWHGYIIAIALFFSVLVSKLMESQQKYYSLLASIQIKTALIDAICSKIFHLNNDSRVAHNIRDARHYMKIETHKVFKFANIINDVWGVPFRLAIGFYFLWTYLGLYCLMGLAVVAVMVPITLLTEYSVSKLQEKRIIEKDKRISLLSEIFHGIKVIKLYAWEEVFLEKVAKIRKQELSYLRKSEYLTICISFVYSTAPALVALACFASYILLDEENVINANLVFVSLSVINLLRYPISSLSDFLPYYLEARDSFARLKKFLNSEEFDLTTMGNTPDPGCSVTIKNSCFSWSKSGAPILKNISLNIKEGSLVAVIGPKTSGKSSLISAFLGEMHRISGTVDIKGSVAYASQRSWIQNTTLQQNIIFTSVMKESWYKDVLIACALTPDIDIFPAGDLTEIGEKGINLSIGQKQKVGLARAVYQDADIYFLDEALCAIESDVADNMFDAVLGPGGILKNKTRLLVTRNRSFLSKVDNIILVKDGSLYDQGTYEEFVQKELIDDCTKLSSNTELFYGENFDMGNYDESSNENSLIANQIPWLEEEKTETAELCNFFETNQGFAPENENILTGKDACSTYFHYAQSIGCVPVMLSIFTAGLYCSCEMATGVWLHNWTNSPEPSQRDFHLIVYSCLVFGQGLFVVLSAAILFSWSTYSASNTHKCLLYHVIRAPQIFFDTTPINRILSRFGRDIESIDIEIPHALNLWMRSTLWIPAVFVVISFTSPFITIIFFPLIMIYYAIQKLYVTTSRQLQNLTSATSSPLNTHFNESLSGVTTIRAFCAENHFLLNTHKLLDSHMNCFFLSLVASRWLDVCLNILGSVVVLVTAILAMYEQEKGAGIIGVALVYSMEVTHGMNNLLGVSSHLEYSIAALERIKEYFEIKQEAEWRNPANEPPTSWPKDGAISIQELSTSYKDGLNPILHNVNMTVMPGEKIGIIGPTEAGKSTLASILFRLIEPTTGKIFIDNIDILGIGLHDLRKKLAIIPQDPFVFSNTIRSNLDPFKSYKDDDLWKALEQSHLKKFVTELDSGLDSKILNEEGNFSFGQCQLICLARCILRKPKILILDEGASLIDVETDKLLQMTIRNVFSDCTVIVFASRLNTVIDYDRVIVMASGEIVEDGAPMELLQDAKSLFHSLAVVTGLIES